MRRVINRRINELRVGEHHFEGAGPETGRIVGRFFFRRNLRFGQQTRLVLAKLKVKDNTSKNEG